MDALPLFAFVGALTLLALLSMRFGYDSRDGFQRPPEGPLWRRPEIEHTPPRDRREVRATPSHTGRVAFVKDSAPTRTANGVVVIAA